MGNFKNCFITLSTVQTATLLDLPEVTGQYGSQQIGNTLLTPETTPSIVSHLSKQGPGSVGRLFIYLLTLPTHAKTNMALTQYAEMIKLAMSERYYRRLAEIQKKRAEESDFNNGRRQFRA